MTDDRDRRSRERGEGSGGGNQPETVEIQHFSFVSVANDNTNESDNSPTSSPALAQRPVGSGGPITPPKLTSKDALMNGMMARDSQVPNEELYDTAFTLQFLKVRIYVCVCGCAGVQSFPFISSLSHLLPIYVHVDVCITLPQN